MSGQKERYQNPVVGDTVTLRLFVFNQKNYANVESVQKVDIYLLDPTAKTPDNPDGRVLIQTVGSSDIQNTDVGKYLLTLTLTDPKFVIGKYIDVWSIAFKNETQVGTITNFWSIYPDMWYTSPTPVVYDFQFRYSPVRFRQGEKKYLRIEIIPNVPTASDLARFYENLAIVSDLSVSIEQMCGPCVPQEADLRLIVEDAPVDFREKRFGYYQLDTTDMDCGIYAIWFKVEFADNIYISEKQQIQVFE